MDANLAPADDGGQEEDEGFDDGQDDDPIPFPANVTTADDLDLPDLTGVVPTAVAPPAAPASPPADTPGDPMAVDVRTACICHVHV